MGAIDVDSAGMLAYNTLFKALFTIVFLRNVYQRNFVKVFVHLEIGGIHNLEVVARKKHIKDNVFFR